MDLKLILFLIFLLQAVTAFHGLFPCYQTESPSSELFVVQNLVTPTRAIKYKGDNLSTFPSNLKNCERTILPTLRTPFYEDIVPMSPKYKRDDPIVSRTPIDPQNLHQNIILPAHQYGCIEIVIPAIINFNEPLILPPYQAELPYGLGYFPEAVPLVEEYFMPTLDPNSANMLVPIANEYDFMTLASPLCPEFDYLVRPIIL